jgi:hypothetical protein
MSSLRKVDPKLNHNGREQSELFAEVASHDVFQPTLTIYPPMKIAELAALKMEGEA